MDVPRFSILGLLFLCVFSVIFVFRNSLTLWFNLVFRHLRKIEFLIFNFFFFWFSLGNYIIQTRVKQMFCYCGFLSISSLLVLEPSTIPLLLEILNITFLLPKERLFCVCCCITVVYQLGQIFVCVTNHSVLLPDDAKYKDEIQREKKCWSLWFCSQFFLEIESLVLYISW